MSKVSSDWTSCKDRKVTITILPKAETQSISGSVFSFFVQTLLFGLDVRSQLVGKISMMVPYRVASKIFSHSLLLGEDILVLTLHDKLRWPEPIFNGFWMNDC